MASEISLNSDEKLTLNLIREKDVEIENEIKNMEYIPKIFNIVKESYEIINHAIDKYYSEDLEKISLLKMKVECFYQGHQNENIESQVYEEVADRLHLVWRNYINKEDAEFKNDQRLYEIHKAYLIQCDFRSSITFIDLLRLFDYFESKDLDEISGSGFNTPEPAKIETSFNRLVPEGSIEDNKKFWNSQCFNKKNTVQLSYLNHAKRQHPIKPINGQNNILITAALPYVNNVPHLGNIVGCVLSADCYSRFCRLRGYNSLYICGTDEYGTATEIKAILEGKTCKEICDKYYELHTKVYSWFNIDFDYFGRTTTNNQTAIASDIFLKMHEREYFLFDKMEQMFCVSCDRFLADRFIEGICPFCSYPDARGDQCDSCGKIMDAIQLKESRCKLCKNHPIVKSSKHMYFDLPRIESEIKSWVNKSSTSGFWSPNALSITNAWLKEGLIPRCVTRDLKWGTSVPVDGYKDKVFYIWFEAPIGYISITSCYTPENWKNWWLPKKGPTVKLTQFMGKDNVPFHTIVFPASLMATGERYALLNNISCTEYLNYESEKFSKSRGVGVFGDNAEESGIPSDIFRFYLLSNRPESSDTSFSWDDLISKNNGDLLNNMGNFVNRSISFVNNNFSGVIPEWNLSDGDAEFVSVINDILKNYVDSMESFKIRDGCKYMLEISRVGNMYVQKNEPWKLIKSENPVDIAVCKTTCALSLNVVALLAAVCKPFIPDSSNKICEMLNIKTEILSLTERMEILIPRNHKINKGIILFNKLEAELAKKLRQKFGGSKADPSKAKAQLEEQKILVEEFISSVDKNNLENIIKEKADLIRFLKSKKDTNQKDLKKEIAILVALKKIKI